MRLAARLARLESAAVRCECPRPLNGRRLFVYRDTEPREEEAARLRGLWDACKATHDDNGGLIVRLNMTMSREEGPSDE